MSQLPTTIFSTVPISNITPLPSPRNDAASNYIIAELNRVRMESACRKLITPEKSYDELKLELEELLSQYHHGTLDLHDFQTAILRIGIPNEDITLFGSDSIRCRVWKILLLTKEPSLQLNEDEYNSLSQEVSI